MKNIVIVGGNDRMIRQYKDICEGVGLNAKVFTQMRDGLKDKIGNPDLLVLFTGTTSHKMVRMALSATESSDTVVVRSHSSSASALRNILQNHAISA